MTAGFLAGIIPMVAGQDLYISRFVPGNPQNRIDVNHRIELFNEGRTYKNLSGYILATRYYVIRIPRNTYVGAMNSFIMGKGSGESGRSLNLEYDEVADFIPRTFHGEGEGDFAILFDRNRNIVDAFYYGPLEQVGFLPDRQAVNFSDGRTEINVPSEDDSRWSYLQNPDDPAMAFICVNRSWHPTSRRTNLFPATRYRFLQAKYLDGVVTVKWKTLFENDCYLHTIERSTDGKTFKVLDELRGPVNDSDPFDYTYYDAEVEKNRVYYYRIVNIDKFGNIVQSNATKIRTEENPGGFAFDILPSDNNNGRRTLNVRFSTRESQYIRVKLLDEQLREIAVLYQGEIEGQKQNLLNYTRPLPIGKYFVIVSTQERRYYEPFVVD